MLDTTAIEEIKAAQEVMQELMKSGEPVSEEEIIEQSVRPLLRAWGYRGLDVKTQYSVKTGSNPKKLDFLIYADKTPVMLIECKALGEDVVKNTNHRDQLRSYFNMLSADLDAHIGLLTNGNDYVFFADTINKHVMDKECYTSFKFVDLKESEFKDTLDRYSKSEIVKFKKREVLLADVRLQKFRAGSKRVADALVHRQGVVPEYLIHSIAEDSGIELKNADGKMVLTKDETKEFASIFKTCVTNAYKDSIGTGEPEPIKTTPATSAKPTKKEPASTPKPVQKEAPKAATTVTKDKKKKESKLELNKEYDIGFDAGTWCNFVIGYATVGGTQVQPVDGTVTMSSVCTTLIKYILDTKPELKEQLMQTYDKKRLAYTAHLQEAAKDANVSAGSKRYLPGGDRYTWVQVEGTDVSMFLGLSNDDKIKRMIEILKIASLPYDTVKILFKEKIPEKNKKEN